MKKGIAALLILLAAFLFYREGFRPEHMAYPVPPALFWQAPPLSTAEAETVEAILSKPLTYLDKGSQSYAFTDASGEYVVKFFKFKHLKSYWFASESKKKRAERKVAQLFESYRLAYESHKNGAGLIYVHLAPVKAPVSELTLIGPWNITYHLDPEPLYFVIQKRGIPLEKLLRQDLAAGDIEKGETHIFSLFDLILDMHKKGLYDKDHALFRNAGFADGEPLHFDVGMLHYDEALKSAERSEGDLKRHAERLNEWFQREFPQDAPHFKRAMEAYVERHFPSDQRG
jgi:hypothetical protein